MRASFCLGTPGSGRRPFGLWPLRGFFDLGRPGAGGGRSASGVSLDRHRIDLVMARRAEPEAAIHPCHCSHGSDGLLRRCSPRNDERGAEPWADLTETAPLPCQKGRAGAYLGRRGCSSMVEQQPSKLNTRVRFPSPAPFLFLGRREVGDGRSAFEAPAALFFV